MSTPKDFNFEEFKTQALKGLYEGQPLTGENGIFSPLLKHFLESSLEAELEQHLQEGKSKGEVNRRNGKSRKQVKGLSGQFELSTPRDRQGSFEPQLIGKRQVILTEGLEEKVLSLYSMGSSYRDITSHIEEIYGMSLSDSQLVGITDKIIPALQQWKSRPLSSLYTFVFMDCMHCKVRENGKVVSRAVYNILGINQEGKKELLGMYLSATEGAKFWLQVLTDLKNRGVEDILIACVDGLPGFPEAITSIFPHTEIQLCVIHQIRSSLRYITEKDKKPFMADLKLVYKAVSEEEGFSNLDKLESKWGSKYPVSVRGWLDNWEYLSPFFSYTEDIRRVMYTTNIIEGYHRQIRKVTKTKGAFSTEMALEKLLYLASQRIVGKWTMPINNWSLVFSQLYIRFEQRVKPHLNRL